MGVGIVDLNGVTMKGFGPSRPGFYFTDLIDWYSLPGSKMEVRERPVSDGAFGFSNDWRQSAVPSVQGFYLGSSRADALAAKAKLIAAARGPLVPLTVTDELGATFRYVSVRNLPIKDDHGELLFQFAIDTIAVDPNRYGGTPGGSGEEVVTTGLPASGTGIIFPITYPIVWGSGANPGQVTVHNPGTATTYSVLEVTGGLSGGFELREVASGRTLRFERSVAVGSKVTLNPRTGRASLDGEQNDVTGFLTRREWWAVPPGSAQVIQFNAIGTPSGTPTLTARTRPAY